MFYKIVSASFIAASFSIEAMAQPVSEAEAAAIMNNYSTGANGLSIHLCQDRNRQSLTGSALSQAFTVKQNEIVKMLNRGDRTLAAGKASSMLTAFGHCYGNASNLNDRPIYARFMGGFIATQALAYNDNSKMQEAIGLLDYANLQGQRNEQFLNLVEEYRAPKLDTGNSEKTSLNTLISGLENNALRFKRDYEGKTVTFDAKVEGINYERLVKKTHLSFKTLTGNNFSGCFLTGENEDKAIDLNKGQKITVTANIKVSESILGPTLRFKNCQI